MTVSRRWNIENGFHAEKHGGFGLEHTFCNDSTASRNLHVVMEIAYALWQVFDMGMLKRPALLESLDWSFCRFDRDCDMV